MCRPDGAIVEHHLAQPVAFAQIPITYQYRIAAIDVAQDQIVTATHHTYVASGDIDPETDLVVRHQALTCRRIDDHILTITQVEEVNVSMATAAQGIVTLTAVQSGRSAPRTHQQIVATATFEGIGTTTAKQGVMPFAPFQPLVTHTASYRVIACAADKDALAALHYLQRAPHGAIGKQHARQRVALAQEPVTYRDGVLAITVHQQQIIPLAGDPDIVGHDPGTKAHLAMVAEADIEFVIDDDVTAIAEVKEIDVGLGVAFEGIVTAPPLMLHHPAVARDEHVIAVTPSEGVLAPQAQQGVITLTTVHLVIARVTNQFVVTRSAEVYPRRPLRDLSCLPHGAVHKQDAANLGRCRREPPLYPERITAVGMAQDEVITHFDHRQITGRNAGAQTNLAVMAHTDAVVDDEIRAIAQIKEIDVLATTALEGVIAGAAVQNSNAALATHQQVVTQPT